MTTSRRNSKKVDAETPFAGPKRVASDNSARRLQIARRAARLSQRQLAARAGVHHSFISLIESGERDFRAVGYETVIHISHAVNVPADELCPVARRVDAKGAACRS